MPTFSKKLKSHIGFEYVGKNPDDAETILRWRNLPEVLQMSCDMEKRGIDQFFPLFLESYFQIPELPSLFCLLEGKRIGFLRFRPYKNSLDCEISIVIDPKFRRKGIGTQVLEKAKDFIRERGFETIWAKIKPENPASKHLFEKAGFTYQYKDASDALTLEIYRFELAKSESKPVFIVAEAGSNWVAETPKKSLKRAFDMIEVAKMAGCDAIKFQTFRAHTLYAPNAGKADYLKTAKIKEKITELLRKLEMPYEMVAILAKEAKKVGIEFMSSVFSEDDFYAVDPYVKKHKIASYENCHPDLLKLCAAVKKPLFLSTGASTPQDIAWALSYYKANGGKEVALLQCSAQYPAKPHAMHLRAIAYLLRQFQVPVGLSDHSLDPHVAPIAAVALGASVIEKHFTLDKKFSGPDHAFALEPQELEMMCAAIRQTEKMKGDYVKKVDPEEEELFFFAKRALQATSKIKKGEHFVRGVNFDILRPGQNKMGAHPKFFDKLEGKIAKKAYKPGEGIAEDETQK